MATTLPLCKIMYSLGWLSHIPLGAGRTFCVDETPVALFRTLSNQVFATQAYCPHTQDQLSAGIVGVDTVICPHHSCEFDLATGISLNNAHQNLKTYAVIVSNNSELLISLE